MANYFDHLNLNGSEAELIGVGGDNTYPGQDLTAIHADEISVYGNPWAWIKDRIKTQNLSKIHVGDYIPITTANNVKLKMQVAGIDTYYNYGDTAVKHHIDFISQELWPTTFKMNLVNFNNGISAEAPHEWLCSNGYAFINSLAMSVPNEAKVNPALTEVDYTAGGIYFYLPEDLKKVIVEKRLYTPARYNTSGLQSAETAGAWQNVGKLWLPFETEITGTSVLGGTAIQQSMGMVQYPIFRNNMARVKCAAGGTSRALWWTASAFGGTSTYFVFVSSYGYVNTTDASSAYRGPVCFRVSE